MTGILNLLAGAVGVVKDTYFNLVTLLLPGNGTNGAQNNTFLDSSTNNFTITRNGNTTQGTFSPFSQTGWSNYFNGTTDSLSMGGSGAWAALSTGNFTVECWIYINSNSATQVIVDARSSVVGTVPWQFYVNSSGKLVFNYGAANLVGTTTISANSWVHVAVVRNGTTISLYINGTAESGTATSSSNLSGGATTYIGRTFDTLGTVWYAGYISNFRTTIGGALYTSNFTPNTTPLTTTVSSGTVSLLTCQSNRFVDNSANGYSITLGGTPSVQAFSPFAPTAAYSAATNGGSGYFDGTGDYLSASSAAAFSFGTGNFTFECWAYRTGSAASQCLYLINANDGFIIYTVSNKVVVRNFNGVDLITSADNLATNAWMHIAVARSGTTLSLWLNGSRASGGTATNSTNFAQGALIVGTNENNTLPYTGYLAGLRVVKGTAVYDPTQASISVPTAPLTNITNTSLLLNFTNAGITDATAKNVLETVGNAQISTAQSKWGGASMAFDGTGDWVASPASSLYNLGTSDFTIEGWFYLNTNSGTQAFAGTWSVSPSRGWFIYFDATIKLAFTYSTTGSNAVDAGFSTLPTANTWVHIAYVRSGPDLKCYLDGVQQGSTHNIGTSSIYPNNQPIYIGERGSSAGGAFNGYIDDLRITKGIARYTANFTPPTSAFPLQ